MLKGEHRGHESNTLAGFCDSRHLTNQGTFHFELRVLEGSRDIVVDPRNERVKLYGLTPSDFKKKPVLADLLTPTESPREYSKVIVYAHPGDDEEWREASFHKEGMIRGFFSNHVNADIWAYYLNPERATEGGVDDHEQIVESILCGQKTDILPALPGGYTTMVANPVNASEIVSVLGEVFSEYPTPLKVPVIENSIRSGASHFRLVRDSAGRLVSVAAAELDRVRKTAEISDCATAPSNRGKSLMTFLLSQLERDVLGKYGIEDLYSLVRSGEPAINKAFRKRGFEYFGRLINNCRMPRGWESMNIWCKPCGPAFGV
ncbi:MAG: hypothetical protein JJD96_08655 [Thermoleophilia bacterium]|nr:hypothetical protein [Thermoleophilia bacterium]